MSPPRRLGPGVERVVGGDALVEVATDGPISLLRCAGGGRDIAVLYLGPPAVEPLLALADRLAWLDGRACAPSVIASGRADEGDEAVVIRLAADAATVAGGLHPLPPEAVVQHLGETLRTVHQLPVDGVPFDASSARLLDLANERVGSGRVEMTTDGPYAQRDPDELLAILAELLAGVDDDRHEPVVIHGRPTAENLWFAPSGEVVLTGWGRCGVGDRHLDLAAAAASMSARYGPAVVAPLFDSYGLDTIDLRRLDAHQLLAHLLG